MRRAQSKQVVRLSGGWEEYYDQHQQAPFYYNTTTGESQWDNPEKLLSKKARGHGSTRINDASSTSEQQWDLRREDSVRVLAVGDWHIYRDPATDRTFYYNAKTNKSQWEAPNDAGLTPVPSTPEAFTAATPKTAATPAQPAHYRPSTPSQPYPHTKSSKWARHEDAETGKSYYYNRVSALCFFPSRPIRLFASSFSFRGGAFLPRFLTPPPD
jgi:hypothetical protein